VTVLPLLVIVTVCMVLLVVGGVSGAPLNE
jgi:hypothetical protein